MSNDKMNLSFIIRDSELMCYKCNKEFPRKFDLNRHLKNTHGEALACQLCDKKLKSGNRRDMRIRHLFIGCPPFKLMFKQCNDKELLLKAKEFANTYFNVDKN